MARDWARQQGENPDLVDGLFSRSGQASADVPFRSAGFHPESSLSFSNPRAPINGQECAIATKSNRPYRNGRRRRHTAIICGEPCTPGIREETRGLGVVEHAGIRGG